MLHEMIQDVMNKDFRNASFPVMKRQGAGISDETGSDGQCFKMSEKLDMQLDTQIKRQ